MATFDFPYHRVSDQYQDSGFRANFGGGYSYAVAPTAPEQRIFILKFKTMCYFVDGNGDVEGVSEPQLNLKTLEDFYLTHKLHQEFVYPHPAKGNINVRFHRPLQIPEGIEGGNGWCHPFELQFIEVP